MAHPEARLIAAGLFALIAPPLAAQQLRAPWTPMPGLNDMASIGTHGTEPGGSFADLSPAVAQEAGLDLRLARQARLEKLPASWNTGLPTPFPDVLTVCIGDAPPDHFVDESRTATGYGVDALRDLARRARPDLEFRLVSTTEWAQAVQGDCRSEMVKAMRALPEQQEATGRLDEAPVPFLVNERARPLRAGLGAVRERLDAIIPGYFSLDAYQALHARWFAPAGFWTPARQTWLSVAAAAAIMGVITSFLWQTRRARRRAENITADLRAVNDRLRVVLDTARSAIFGLTRDGRIAFANAGARRLLGLADSPAPQNWPDGARFVDPDSRKPLAPAHSPLRRPAVPGSGAPWHSDILALQRPDDTEPRFVTLSSAPLPDGRADGIASVIVMDDVTDQERARQREERSSRLDALGQLTGGVAHDFNNILATIDYAVQLALPHADDAGRRYLDTAAQSVRRGADLTARLLAFAKRQSGAPGSHRVTDVLAEFRDLAVPAIEERIELLFSAPPEGLHVHCDLPQLENALLNLVLNSRDAIRSSGPASGGRITLSVREVHDLIDPDIASHGDPVPRRVEFTIADNGPGMTDDVRKRATDPFFTTKPEGTGSGLGLAMVYGFAETSGGTLALYSVPGAGTTVRLTLPAGTPEGNVVAPEHRTPVTVAGHERILLVEDEPALVDLVAETLRAWL